MQEENQIEEPTHAEEETAAMFQEVIDRTVTALKGASGMGIGQLRPEMNQFVTMLSGVVDLSSLDFEEIDNEVTTRNPFTPLTMMMDNLSGLHDQDASRMAMSMVLFNLRTICDAMGAEEARYFVTHTSALGPDAMCMNVVWPTLEGNHVSVLQLFVPLAGYTEFPSDEEFNETISHMETSLSEEDHREGEIEQQPENV